MPRLKYTIAGLSSVLNAELVRVNHEKSLLVIYALAYIKYINEHFVNIYSSDYKEFELNTQVNTNTNTNSFSIVKLYNRSPTYLSTKHLRFIRT